MCGPSFDKLESPHLKFGENWPCRRHFLQMLIFYKLFYNYLPMWKFGKFWIPFTQGCFVQIWLKLSQWLLSRWWQVYKNNKNTQWTKLTWAWMENQVCTYKNNFVGDSRDLLLIIKKRVWATKAAIIILNTGTHELLTLRAEFADLV